jgi:hypothetical protein
MLCLLPHGGCHSDSWCTKEIQPEHQVAKHKGHSKPEVVK